MVGENYYHGKHELRRPSGMWHSPSLLTFTFPPKPRTHRWYYQSSKLVAVLVAKQHVSVVRQEVRVSHSKTSEA